VLFAFLFSQRASQRQIANRCFFDHVFPHLPLS
jgi:hypothetical protein